MSIRLGCQTITWGEEQYKHFPEICKDIADAGFDGLEIGLRHVQKIELAGLKDILEGHGLEILGFHVGGDLRDESKAVRASNLLDEIIEYTKFFGAKYVCYSGRDCEGDSGKINALVKAVDEYADACSGAGLQLVYHNHAHEFKHDAVQMKALASDTSPNVAFVPDHGLAMIAGFDPMPILERIKDRIKCVHFRDIVNADPFKSACLGEGKIPVDEMAEWYKKNTDPDWVISEHNKCDLSEAEATRKDAKYLISRFK